MSIQLTRIERREDRFFEARSGNAIHGLAGIKTKTFLFNSSIEHNCLGREALIEDRVEKEFAKDKTLLEANGYEIISSGGDPFPTWAEVRYVNYVI